jgi:hypothetical protein
MNSLIALIAVGTMVPLGAATVRLPDLGQLTLAVRSGDEVEVERVAARLGSVRLQRVAEKGKREERLAALKALALVSDGWAMLPAIARLCGDRDIEVAEAAAITARRIAEGMTPQSLETDEVPRDVPTRAAVELLDQAARPELLPSVRVSALAALAALRGVTRVDETRLAKLFTDPEPQVRRATAEALAGVPSGDKPLETALAGDTVVEVAAAAAASLCRDVPSTAMAKHPAELRAGKLGAPARERLRTLAVDETISLADRIDLVGCLRVALQPADQKVLDQLAKKPPESLKRRARSLGGR